MGLQGKKWDLSFVRCLVRFIQNLRVGFIEWDFTSLLGQFCVLATAEPFFPPSQSKAKLIVDLGHWLPASKKIEEIIMIIVISKEGKVTRGWWEPRIESTILRVLSLTADKTLAVPLAI